LFILDEVMTGFRVALGGAQQLWNLTPDITCLREGHGGGLPVGVYAGKRHIMEHVAPSGSMYQAGTLSGNPLAMAAGLSTLRILNNPEHWDTLPARTQQLCDGLRQVTTTRHIPAQIDSCGSMFGCYFLQQPDQLITNYATAKAFAHTQRYARVFHTLLNNGVYFAPSQFEAGFMSIMHTADDISYTIQQFEKAILACR
jgi:glutamate-1-semialdehyde 2,1-aminomutase